MMRSLSAAKAPLDFVPGEMDDRRTSVDIVRRQSRVAQRREQRAHLSLGEVFSSLDRRLAGDGRRQPLVLGGGAGDPVSGQRIQRFPQTTLGIESRMRHRYRIHDQSVAAESFDLEAEPLEIFAIGVEGFTLGGPQM